jgi:transcriptional regulator with XRE-family HTH domain
MNQMFEGDTEMTENTLRQLRELSGMTQTEVARRMSVTQGRVSQIERDFPRLNFVVVSAYIEALGGKVEFTALGGTDVRADTVAHGMQPARDRGDRTALRSAS